MPLRILTVNAGSSSVKLSVVEDGDVTTLSTSTGAPGDDAVADLRDFVSRADRLDAVGHRLVHGGDLFTAPVIVTDSVRMQLEQVSELAPLHMPPALALLDAAMSMLDVAQVACFDTAFHATLPEAARIYAIPSRWRDLGVRRYGFHGLSCAWSLQRAAALLDREPSDLQLVVAHLGAGASVTAIRDGRSVDTSMGFTPLEGLVMATRSGSVDPGALTWLQHHSGVDAAEMERRLEHESGVLALAGTADLREVEQRAAGGDAVALLATAVYAHRAAACIASVAASLQRLDALVFTGGVGEHSHAMRSDICARLATLGVPSTLRERDDKQDCVVSNAADTPLVLVVTAREDLQMAREVRSLVSLAP